MNIVIPLGGKGERFLNQGYVNPKPLIHVGHKEMIRHVIDRLSVGKEDTITILYHQQLDKHNFSGLIRTYYPQIQLVPIPFQTRGAVETIDYGLRSQTTLNEDKKCLLLDCDAFYTDDIVQRARQHQNGVFVFREEDISQPAKFSYVSVEEDGSNRITDIAEKSRISSFANTGAYLFESCQTLLSYTKKVIEEDFRFCNEFYTSCVIKCMLMDGYDFRKIELSRDSYMCLGTPEQMTTYLSNCHAFLFDLDGTLVDTTKVYVQVWKSLLEPYHANVDDKFFKNHINGNNDEMVFQMLIPKLTKQEKKQLSSQKDVLFLQGIEQIKIVKGAIDFLYSVRQKGHVIGIVTNCNRLVAETILLHCGIDKIVDVLVIGNECDYPKPYPHPYQKAKELLKLEKVIVFEDSCSGLLSASGIYPQCLVGVSSLHSHLEQYGAHFVIDDFTTLCPSDLLDFKKEDPTTKMERLIMESVKERWVDLEHVRILSNKLKGGYIADVIRVDLVFQIGNIIECVAKLQSETNSNLSDMAIQLGLYKREQYFYEVIRDHVRIRTPRYLGTIRDENQKPCGILLEFLPAPRFELDKNLETESFDLTLKIVRRIASHHARFWGKDLMQHFPQLTKNNHPDYYPHWNEYIQSRWPRFKDRWFMTLTQDQLDMGEWIVQSFLKIQQHLSQEPLTLCHGDVKSPNIFFENGEPIFIDWQYIIIGKGVQDLVFLMIESFSAQHISKVGNILKEYYYLMLLEEGVENYSQQQFENDFQISICYFPFFVALWFGTTPPNQLIDVNFPFFFIQKLFSFMTVYLDRTMIASILQQ